jgi:hypothetical protein
MGLLTLAAAAAWWPVYASAPFVVLVLVTVVVGCGIGAAGALGRWQSHWTLLATVAAWLVLGVPLAVPAKALFGVLPSGDGIVDLVVTTATGWRQLLTIEIPVGSYQALLVPVFVTLLAASVVGVSVASRTRRPVLALIAPAVVLVLGILFGGSDALLPSVVGGVFAVLAIGWIVASRGRLRARAVVTAGGVVALGLVMAVATTVLLPPPDRVVARNAVARPFDPREYASPLAGFRSYLKAPESDAVLFTITGAAPGTRVAIARMDDYDGVVYDVGGANASALFNRVPGRLAAAPGASGADVVHASVQIEGYEGVWVPTIGDPQAVAFTGERAAELQNALFYSPQLSTAADTAGLHAGDSYDLTASLAASAPLGAAALAGVTPGSAALPAPAGDLPAAIAERLAQWAPSDDSPGEKLAGIVAGLRTGYLSHGGAGEPFSRSGHGVDRIQELLTATPMLGDDEQYAVAGALLAEAAGFPARVAMGFTVPDAASTGAGTGTGTGTSTGSGGAAAGGAFGASGASGASGALTVRGQDASAWTEVYTAQDGWIALDPTPDPKPIPETSNDDDKTAVQPPDIVPPRSDNRDDITDSTPLQQNDDNAPPQQNPWSVVLRVAAISGLALALVAIVLAPFLTILALKRRRRIRRRTRGSPRLRAAGGWAEFVDAVRDAQGAPPGRGHATRRELAAVVAPDAPGAVVLATEVDRALYSPDEPTPDEIERIWADSDAQRGRLLASRSRLARLFARLSIRSLRTYHGNDGKGRANR